MHLGYIVLPKVNFTESGWMLVRVVTKNQDAYRFTSSAPIYVSVGDQPIQKKESIHFFLDWITERGKQVARSNDPAKTESLATSAFTVKRLRDGGQSMMT